MLTETRLWRSIALPAIAAWWADMIDGEADEDAHDLYVDLIVTLGKHRKGDASKIRDVALASVRYELQLRPFTSLHAAYVAARRAGERCSCPYCPGHRPL